MNETCLEKVKIEVPRESTTPESVQIGSILKRKKKLSG